MSDTAPVPDDFICFAVYSAGHAFNRVYKPLLSALGLTYPQYLVLVALWAKDDRTVGSLGETLFLESSTLTPLLKRLEGMGLLARRRDPDDERQVRVRLTEAGAALRDKARDFPSCVDGATGLSEDALRRLRSDILSVRTALLKTGG
ncbi:MULTISPECIES: MarR family winged helix-turn-helix transcriptional regulator [unclassified Inquilinus]|uniref:MarR family winged helix-turn-helix transcriptional regulator n=1 Tax=unclassified Inquilinus TaxID=2645927 RepID=UPI003F937783